MKKLCERYLFNVDSSGPRMNHKFIHRSLPSLVQPSKSRGTCWPMSFLNLLFHKQFDSARIAKIMAHGRTFSTQPWQSHLEVLTLPTRKQCMPAPGFHNGRWLNGFVSSVAVVNILNVLYVMYDLRITYGRHFGALLPFHWPNGQKAKDQKILERILVVSVWAMPRLRMSGALTQKSLDELASLLQSPDFSSDLTRRQLDIGFWKDDTHTHNLTSPDADMCTINRPRSNQASQESSGSSGLSAGSFRDRMTMRRRSCTSLPAGSLLQDCGHAMWKFCVRLVMSCSKSIAIRQWFRMMCIEAEEPIRIRKDLRPYWLWKLRDCIFVGTRTLVLKVLES